MSRQELQQSEGAIYNKKTLGSYFVILNKINDYFGLERDIIHFDELNKHADEIPGLVKQFWSIRSMAALKQKIGSISSLMNRTGFEEDYPIKQMFRKLDRFESIEATPVEENIPDWETDLLPRLKDYSKDNTICGIIARVFSYGYVLRVSEMFQTRTNRDDGVNNFLDLDNCKWIIRKQKNKTFKSFDVDPELCKTIPRGNWLLSKKDTTPYKQAAWTLYYHGWELPSNTIIRKSFETWNIKNNSEEEAKEWHKILGHSKIVAHDYYNVPKKTSDGRIKVIIKKKKQKQD